MFFILRPWIICCNIIYFTFVWIFSLIRCKKPPSIPPITDSLLMISATELAEKIRKKECTSYAVVLAYIKRIKEVNLYINAVVEDRYQDALAEAKNCDALLETGKVDIITLKKQKPLYGVPFSVKESCPVKGLSHTGCTLALKGRKAIADCVVVSRLRDAGAIPLCVTNTPEMCCSFDSYNFLYGRSYNPYDTRYISGGSSGGEAALLGAGASLIGVGSDLIGSIKMPGLFCGIFGLKSTSKVIPSKDHFPLADLQNFQDFATMGPMSRYADDLTLVMKVVSTKSDNDLCLDDPIDWKQMKVYYQQNLGKPGFSILSISPELEQCVVKAAGYFSGRGVNTEQIPIEWPSSLFEMIVVKLLEIRWLNLLIDINDPTLEKNPAVEMVKAVFGLSHHTMSLLYFAVIMKILHLWQTKLHCYIQTKELHYLREFKKFQQKLQELLGKNGILIYPTFRVTATFPELVFSELGNSLPYSALANVLGFPAVQVPMGFNSNGIPIGLQVIAAPYQERLCLAAAKELETAFGGWVPPSISINN